MKKRIVTILMIVFICLSMIGTSGCGARVSSKAETNCDTLHKAYAQVIKRRKAGNYNTPKFVKNVVSNFGLCKSSVSKEWNGVWVLDEDFIRTYIEKYSAEEFLSVYEMFVYPFFDYEWRDDDWKGFYSEYNGNLKEFIQNVNNSTDIIFTVLGSGTMLNPVDDTPINQTSETEKVNGDFNVGADNHIVSGSTTCTTDTFYYDGYYVVHRYGEEYYSGIYGWYNGVFKDVKPSFEPVDEWRLYLDGESSYLRIGDSLAAISSDSCDSFVVDGITYYRRIVHGTEYTSFPLDLSFPTSKEWDEYHYNDSVFE